MHDYDISWDYMLDDNVEYKNKKLLNNIIKDIKKTKLSLLKGIKNFSAFCIILPNGILGVYCNGTYKKPIIGLDIGNIISSCEKYNCNIGLAIKTTILHELKHAEQNYLNLKFNENEAEDFAYMNS